LCRKKSSPPAPPGPARRPEFKRRLTQRCHPERSIAGAKRGRYEVEGSLQGTTAPGFGFITLCLMPLRVRLVNRPQYENYRRASLDRTAEAAVSTWSYFPANSFFTASLTTFPSTRIPAAAKRAMAFFITAPISFIVGEPISTIAAFTPAAISTSPAALGI
jgi:hypothetical protein